MIEVSSKGFDAVQRKLKAAKTKIDLVGWMNRSCARVQRYAKIRRFRLGGQGRKGQNVPPVPHILTARTNFLRGSILWQVEHEGRDLVGRIGVGQQVAYARIHEFGGYAGRGHRAHIPPRPYLHPALEAERENIMKDLGQLVRDGLKQAGLI